MDSTGTTPASVTTGSGILTSTFPSFSPSYEEFPFPSSTSSSPWEPEKMPPLSQAAVEAKVRSLSSTVLAAPTHLPDWVMPEVLPDDNASTVITAVTAATTANVSLPLYDYINGNVGEVEEVEYPADDFHVQVAMTIIYAVICLAGIVGNVATCIVISRNRIMHTATNYYLFSMAISDLLLLVTGFPHEMHSIWLGTPYRFGETFCIIRGLAAETSTNASILTITMFTVERYIGICHPIRSHTMSKLGRVVKFVMGIWVLAGVCAVPQCVQYGLVYKLNPDNTTNYSSLDCVIKNPLSYSFEISTCLFFVVPMTLITVLYVKIGLTLKRSTALGRAASALSGRNVGSASTERRKNKAVVKMLVAVVVAFFICWAPFHAQRLLALYGDAKNPVTVLVYDVLTYASGILFYVSATINPILYHIMSKRFRQALKNTLESCYGTKYGSNGGRWHTYVISSSSSRFQPETTTLELTENTCLSQGTSEPPSESPVSDSTREDFLKRNQVESEVPTLEGPFSSVRGSRPSKNSQKPPATKSQGPAVAAYRALQGKTEPKGIMSCLRNYHHRHLNQQRQQRNHQISGSKKNRSPILAKDFSKPKGIARVRSSQMTRRLHTKPPPHITTSSRGGHHSKISINNANSLFARLRHQKGSKNLGSHQVLDSPEVTGAVPSTSSEFSKGRPRKFSKSGSIWSDSSISNCSMQLTEEEYTRKELSDIMGELNKGSREIGEG